MIERSDDGGKTWKKSGFGEFCESVMQTYESQQAVRTAIIKIKRGDHISTTMYVFRWETRVKRTPSETLEFPTCWSK